jgi:hypothetical protein
MMAISNLKPQCPIEAVRDIDIQFGTSRLKVKKFTKGVIVRKADTRAMDLYVVQFDGIGMTVYCEYGEDIRIDGTALPIDNHYDRREDFDDGPDDETEE